MNTLIVEDNAAFRWSLSELLRANFPAMQVAQAGNVGEAWKQFAAIRPGLVFVDIKLQAENGLELTRSIHDTHPDVVVAIITGHNFPEYRQAAFQSGAHCFVPKDSVTSADILTLIESIQSGRPLQWGLGAEYINPFLPIGSPRA